MLSPNFTLNGHMKYQVTTVLFPNKSLYYLRMIKLAHSAWHYICNARFPVAAKAASFTASA